MSPRFVSSGQWCLGENEEVLATAVGSCVAVCVFDESRKIGGMAHYLLPRAPAGKDGDTKYGDVLLRALFLAFKRGGSKREHLVVKIVGGASDGSTTNQRVAKENVAVAEQVCTSLGIPIASRSVGGTSGRIIQFSSGSGVLRFKMASIPAPSIETEELCSRGRVLIVDDSAAVRKVLRKLIAEDPTLEVVAEAQSSKEAEAIIRETKIDVMTLDLHMPGASGVDLLRALKSHGIPPTIIVSDCNRNDSGPVLTALELGAFDYLKKPAPHEFDEKGEELRSLVREARRSQERESAERGGGAESQGSGVGLVSLTESVCEGWLLAIGASTGGTEAIKETLRGLPASIPPVLIVQHMPAGFTEAFANRLDSLFPFRVKEGEQDEVVKKDTVYIAPGGFHMEVIDRAGLLRIVLSEAPPVNRFRPSVDVLFKSLAKVRKRKIAAALLTGMGDDGARGLLELRQSGARTLCQDEQSCVVYGMPKAAYELGATSVLVPIERMGNKLVRVLSE